MEFPKYKRSPLPADIAEKLSLIKERVSSSTECDQLLKDNMLQSINHLERLGVLDPGQTSAKMTVEGQVEEAHSMLLHSGSEHAFGAAAFSLTLGVELHRGIEDFKC